METLAHDVRFARRGLLRQPSFLITALASLALGIGVNSAIFSVANSLLLRPLPYQNSGRLVILWNRSPGLNIAEDWFSTAQYFDILNGHHGFEQLAIAIGANFNLTGEGGDPERIGTIRVSSNLLPMLGVKPAKGRLFVTAEDNTGHAPSALLSWGMWMRRFGGAPNVLGKSIRLNGVSREIVGILPESFTLPHEVLPTLGGAENAEVLLPLPMDASAVNNRDHEDYNIIGRLKPGVTIPQARAEMETITSRLRREHPDVYPPNGGLTFDIVPLLEQVVGNVRYPLLLFGGAVGLVLIMACANVTNLQLSRSVARRKEIGVRLALGATRARIVKMALTESVLLALAGGALGIPLAYGCLAWIRTLGKGSVPRLQEIGLDGRVVLFTFLLCLVAGVLSGMAPALRLGRLDVNESLKSSTRGASGNSIWSGGNNVRKLLVAGELALCTVVLSGAGLFVRSYAQLERVDPGFDASNVQTFELTMTGMKYNKPAPILEAYRQLWDRLEHMPGQRYAGGISSLPISEIYSWGPITIEGRTSPAGENFINADERFVGGHYFQAMNVPLRRGRFFDDHDSSDAPRVAVIDEYMADQFWPGQDPLGKRFRTGGLSSKSPWITIAGVVGRVKQYTLDADSRIAIYIPQRQFPTREMYVVAKGSRILPASGAREAVAAVDPELPVYQIKPMSARFEESLARQRFSLLLFSLFAALGLVLGVVGLYGLMAFLVSQGTRDIGIRIALGATGRSIRVMILKQATAVAVPGLVGGVLGTLAVGRVMQSLLFNVKPSDPATIAAVPLLAIAVLAGACWIPARRASRVDPMISLRTEE